MIDNLKKIMEKRIVRLTICIGLFIIMSIQFSSSVLYSLDDYYLEDIYNLNWQTVGYNWYGYGRLGEAVLGQIFYWLNLSPFNGIGAYILWGIAITLLADYIVTRWNVKNDIAKMLIMLCVVFNPFFVELYFYKNVLAFSAIAVLSLRQGLVYMDKFWAEKKKRYMIWSFIFTYFSLSIYQIFFPIIFMIYAVAALIEINREKHIKETVISFIAMMFFLIAYYVILNIMFICYPSTIVYPGADIKKIFRSIFFNEDNYWYWIKTYLKAYFLSDNDVSSGILNIIILVIFNIGIIGVTVYEAIHNKQKGVKKLLVYFVLAILIEIVGMLSCFGFSLTSIFDASSRSFTAWGVYLAGLMCLLYEKIKKYEMKKWGHYAKTIVMSLLVVFSTTNACRLNRCAADIYKQNQNEAYLINRIVARLESFDSFDSNCIPIYVYGYANLSSGYDKILGCLNKPVVGGFSTVYAFREVSGYNFQVMNAEGYNAVLESVDSIPSWPKEGCIVENDYGFFIKLSD